MTVSPTASLARRDPEALRAHLTAPAWACGPCGCRCAEPAVELAALVPASRQPRSPFSVATAVYIDAMG